MAPASVRNGVNTAPLQPGRLDPKALLNPRAFNSSPGSKSKIPANPYTSSSTAVQLLSPASSKSSTPSRSTYGLQVGDTQGQGSLIERMHNVERREDRPVKRQKKSVTDGESDDGDLRDVKRKTKSEHIGGSGDMGEYLKEKHREALEKQGPPPLSQQVVDLTADNDTMTESDDLIVTSDSSTQEVCLGRVDGARVNAHKVPQPKAGGTFSSNAKHWAPMRCTLQRRPGPNNIIAVADPMGHDFGNLDPRTAVALSPLMEGNHVTKLRVQARLDSRNKKPFDYPGQAVSDNYSITLNLYAPRKFVHAIGKFLSQKQVWLRDPLAVDHGVTIINPHAPKDHTPTQKAVLAKTARISSQIIVRTQEEARNDVYAVFNAIQENKDLPAVDAPPEITTPLLFHQKQAVYFLRKREMLPIPGDVENAEVAISDQLGTFWKEKLRGDRKKTWVNVITGHEVLQKPAHALGGILADVMGLGKTLNILSLIVGSLTEAQEWGNEKPSEDDQESNPAVEMNTKATLLICPLSTIVNWEDQIKTHLKQHTIKYTIYQGANRTNDAYKLKNNDLVITTYPTIAAEINANKKSRTRPNSPLFELNWFRVALDEAHTIRKQSTIQSRACCTLSASRRWCITGTPVQNRLDDLGALIKFLKIKPFDEVGNFSTFISTPLRTGDNEAIPKLRLLVDSITLRRLKDKIDLPPRTEQIVKLAFNDEERKLYDFFQSESFKNIEAMTGKNKTLGGKSYAHVLRVIGRLRMLCVHGSDMLSSEDWDKIKGWDPSNAIDVEDEEDDRPDRPASQVFEMYRMMKDAQVHFCAKCNKFITTDETENLDEDYESSPEDVDEELLGYMTPCNHLICPKCIDKFSSTMKDRAGIDNYASCQICDNYIRITFFPIKRSELQDDERAQEELRKSSFAKNLSRYSGPSAKVRALLEDLAVDEVWSAEHPKERPIKSVVFSEWVTMLDLMQLAFTSKSIQFARLDGRMAFSARQNAINTFMTSRNVNVILVSLKAGGLGLNLTAASRVYTMEPNYNPAAEAQAVERVHRLGQTREVVIKRYVMEDTIEEKVLRLQERKLALAEFSVERDTLKKMTKADVQRQKLEDLKSLLR